MRENWVDWLFVCFEICHECKMDVDMDVDYGMNVDEKWDCIYLYFVCYLRFYDVMIIVINISSYF